MRVGEINFDAWGLYLVPRATLHQVNRMTRRTVEIARVYEDPGRRTGDHRVLVDRLWPRGVPKASLDHDEWAKEVAPSPELRKWYGHEPQRFEEFSKRYQAELACPPASEHLERLREVAARQRLVLLTATRDLEHSGAAVLAGVITRP